MSFVTITEVLLQYPQGAMEKTIEVNQSQIVNGVTITLERVELSWKEAKFYAFATPPGYSLRQGPAWAQYTADGITKDAGPSGVGFQEDGMRLSWGTDRFWSDPVPSDAKELTFTINEFGDWQGPWEFQVPLE
mgnify:CR=1 FL=1